MGSLAARRALTNSPQAISDALSRLPQFPNVALRALNVRAGKNSSLGELYELVNSDALFAAEILRIANSPLIAFSREITSVLQASMLLGFRRLRSLVVTVGLRSYMENSSTPVARYCFRHSVACAMVAEQIARWNSGDRDFAYSAGILHDIGRVALAALNPADYAVLMERAVTDPAWDTLQSEREYFGIDHCSAGRMLLEGWKLPEPFIAVTSHHHEPLTRQQDVSEVVRLSCLLADALGFAAVRHPSIQSPGKILAEFPENARKQLPPAEELAAAIIKELGVIEARSAIL